MATSNKPTRNIDIPGWSPKYGRVKCHVTYRVANLRERYRRLLALVFAVLISLIVGTFIVSIEPISTAIEVFMAGTVVIIGMTLIGLIFGLEINDVSITREGAVLNFGESGGPEE